MWLFEDLLQKIDMSPCTQDRLKGLSNAKFFKGTVMQIKKALINDRLRSFTREMRYFLKK